MTPRCLRARRRAQAGFTLVEMIVVVLLLSIAMLGILAVFDASARINKSETDVADAQGAVRYGVYQMTRAIRMAGSGGLFVTQAVLNHRDPQLPGITLVNSADADSFDNVEAGTTVSKIDAANAVTAVPVRPGTDMIEVRGVLQSPLVAFDDDPANGCQNANNVCVGAPNVDVKAATNLGHVNDDAGNRPQFAAVDAYTAGASGNRPLMVLVASNIDVHSGCSGMPTPQRYPQPLYNVGVIVGATNLTSSQTFGSVDFSYSSGGFRVIEYDTENPIDSATTLGYNFPSPIKNPLRSAGILDDYLFFIDNTDPVHPALAQGIRRGANFDVVRIADDVEDMQIAYGVDVDGDGRINRFSAPAPPDDPDPNVSTAADDDEWAPNVPGEAVVTPDQFQQDGAAAGQSPPFPHGGPQPAAHCPRLHGVMISLIAKGRDPDPTYRADGSLGFRIMNSPVSINPPFPDVAIYPTPPPEPHYRRRIQTLKINLRNYANEG